jgi:RND family efflux transporter MFP subunit
MKISKKWLKLLVIPLVLTSLGTLAAGCGSETEATTVSEITATAQRGNLVVDITAVGNLTYSTEEELSFDTGGTLSEVLVDVGDSVTAGQVLAKLDLTEWQQNITDLESALATREQALTQTKQSLTAAERAVTTKQNAVTTAERAVETAKYNLTQKEMAVEETKLNIESAELSLKQAQYNYDLGLGDEWAEEELAIQKQQLVLTKASLEDAEQAVETAKYAISDAEINLENAKLDVTDAETNVTLAQASVENAEKDVADAQSALDEAKATNPDITAPFDGLIIQINTEAGSEVYKGGAVVTIVKPDQFEANVSVGETDINDVTVDGDATVELDAIPNLVLPAMVTAISPTATTSSGVVSYTVTITIDSDKALQEGITEAQLSQLKEGLTATVSIIVQQAENAILIPTQAVTTTAEGYTVNVKGSDGTITTRSIQTGISNSKYTVVTEGLEEGEQVVYTRTTTSSTESSSGTNNNGNVFGAMGGMGGMP